MNNDLYCLEEMLYKQKIEGIPYVDKPKTLEERNRVILFYVPTILKVIKSKFLNHPLYKLEHHIGIDDLFQEAVIVAAKTVEKFQKEYCHKSDFQSHLVYCIIVELKRLLLRHNRLTTTSQISRQRGGWKEERENIFYFDELEESDELDKNKKLFSFLKSTNLIFSDNGGNGDDNQARVEQLIKSAKLSPLEEKVLKFRFGLDGKTLNNAEIGSITDLSSNVSVPIFYERAMRKLISVNSQPKESKELFQVFSQGLENILLCSISERERIIFRVFYGINGWRQKIGKIAKKEKISRGQVGNILRQSRRRIAKSKDLPSFLKKIRQELLSLIYDLKLVSLHQELLAKFYCLDGKFYPYDSNSGIIGKKYFSLWKAQQKFKSSLSLLVGLAKFSRDMAKIMEKKEGGEEK